MNPAAGSLRPRQTTDTYWTDARAERQQFHHFADGGLTIHRGPQPTNCTCPANISLPRQPPAGPQVNPPENTLTLKSRIRRLRRCYRGVRFSLHRIHRRAKPETPSVKVREAWYNLYALRTRKSAGFMMRKLSVTESQSIAQFFGTSSRRKCRTARHLDALQEF